MAEGGYAPADLFKPSATREQFMNTVPSVETPVAEPPVTETPPATPVETAQVTTEQPPTETPVETPAPVVTPAVPVPEPVQIPAVPVDPFASLTPEGVAKHFKDKRDDLLKAIGLDDFSIEAIKYYESTGGLADYAAVKSVDYSKMSDDDVLRKGLREEFAHLNLEDEDLELLYETRITNRFKLDEATFSEREIKAGKLEMKLEADRLRTQYVEKQKKFAPPVREPQPDPEPEVSPEQQAKEALQFAMSDSSVQQFISNKKLVLGSGDQTFNYEVGNPTELLDILFNPEEYAKRAAKRDASGAVLKDAQGHYLPDYNRLLKAVAVLHNGDEYDRMLINYGKTLGTKAIVDEIENPTNNQSAGTDAAPSSVWGAMKQNGVKWI